MRILYIANIRFPTERAHGIQIAKMCEAFASLGNEVTLLIPARFNHIKENSFEYYDIQRNFTITKLPCVDLVRFGKLGFWIELASFSMLAFFYALLTRFDIIYTRDEIIAWVINIKGNVAWEAHMGQRNFFVKAIMESSMPVIVISNGLKSLYEDLGVNQKRILVAPDGVDLKKFVMPINRKECRKRFGLPEATIIMYTGHLYDWKGVDTLAEAVQLLGENVIGVFVGGTEIDIANFKNKYEKSTNIMVLGHKPSGLIPYYIRVADVLVVPNSGKVEISRNITSPLKLFEYMASGVPIVSSDIPSLREILDEDSAFFAIADNHQSFAEVIERVISNPVRAKEKARNAKDNASKYSWNLRAEKIIEFVKHAYPL